MSYLLVAVFLGVAAWEITAAFELLFPHMTARQRWFVVAYIGGAAGCVSLAFRFGDP